MILAFISKINETIMKEYEILTKKTVRIRKQLLKIIYHAKSGHTGGSLSSVDILTALYFNIMNINPAHPKAPDRDRFILSKGHSVEAYYCTLCEAGFFSHEILNSYGKIGSVLAGHPTVKVPGVELNSGALGHGLSVGAGMALVAKRDKKKWKVYVLMGDGEQGEGAIMEAAMTANHYKLSNLIAIIDRNRLQISGDTEHVMQLECLKQKWTAFGWEVLEVDGNNISQIIETLNKLPVVAEKPHLLIANTIKGKGVSFIENKAIWHHKVPNATEYQQAIEELDNQLNDKNHEQ